ncbi:hypothetical protein G7Y89_g6947 [Cudoniella acicularis]|uniref:Uncharacterized protein n=1 Tax=Cudoniella acicularis TaxID=354080 RepID=A0A8H4RJG4_9HELO|nr:hypothetical protein G7Y89_g6947 [Cudoniella acicularis]
MQKCYFLAPTLHFPPNGPIALGNIIASPSYPDSPINTSPPPPIPTSMGLYNIIESNWKTLRERQQSCSGGIWTTFLHILIFGGDIDISKSGSLTEEYHFRKLVTRYFQPTIEYIKTSVYQQDVQDFIVGHKGKGQIYMITGVKIASGATVAITEAKKRGLHFQLGVDATPAGVPIAMGPKLERGGDEVQRTSSEIEEDFVFAYRLTQIKIRKKGGLVYQQYDKEGELFGVGNDEGDKEEGEGDFRDQFEIEELVEHDVCAEEFGMKSVTVLDDDGKETCQSVIPLKE